jgi:hypothetical protein
VLGTSPRWRAYLCWVYRTGASHLLYYIQVLSHQGKRLDLYVLSLRPLVSVVDQEYLILHDESHASDFQGDARCPKRSGHATTHFAGRLGCFDSVLVLMASRVALSRMERIPRPVSAEHSMYPRASILLAISCPCEMSTLSDDWCD